MIQPRNGYNQWHFAFDSTLIRGHINKTEARPRPTYRGRGQHFGLEALTWLTITFRLQDCCCEGFVAGTSSIVNTSAAAAAVVSNNHVENLPHNQLQRRTTQKRQTDCKTTQRHRLYWLKTHTHTIYRTNWVRRALDRARTSAEQARLSVWWKTIDYDSQMTLALWRVVSATSDLRLPSQLQSITALWSGTKLYCLSQRQTGVNDLPRVAARKKSYAGRQHATRPGEDTM